MSDNSQLPVTQVPGYLTSSGLLGYPFTSGPNFNAQSCDTCPGVHNAPQAAMPPTQQGCVCMHMYVCICTLMYRYVGHRSTECITLSLSTSFFYLCVMYTCGVWGACTQRPLNVFPKHSALSQYYICLCVWVHVRACVRVSGCAICLYVKTERHIMYPLLCSLLYSLETGSFLNLEFFLWGQGWQSKSPSASRISIPLLPSLQLGVTGVHSRVQLFTQIVGIWAQVLLLAQQELLSTELSPPGYFSGQNLSLNPELTNSARLTGQRDPRMLLASAPWAPGVEVHAVVPSF